MFAQYFEIKRAHPDTILFFRMGDFYEMFFDDAVRAAPALDIALTKRGQHAGADVPMCGVPAHSHEAYLNRLIEKGFKVSICEQTEDPVEARKRGGKALVAREVLRTVTPGTITEDALLDSRAHNHLAALARAEGALALAWLDISTGDFSVATSDAGGLAAILAQVAPGELLVSDRLAEDGQIGAALGDWIKAISALPAARFDSLAGERRLKTAFEVAALDAFGAYTRAELAACGALLDYVELTQKGRTPRLAPPRRQLVDTVMAIDSATRRNLELTQALGGGRAGSLLGVIDRTVTGAGARLLSARLAAPLCVIDDINRRLDQVQWFTESAEQRTDLRATLGRCPDIERALARLSLGRGGPRDLAAIRDAVDCAGKTRGVLAGTGTVPVPEALAVLAEDLGSHSVLSDRLSRALGPDLPLQARDGGFIAPGYAPDLDELRVLRDESRRLIAALQVRYRDETGIATLKITHNNVLGYFVEVRPAQADSLGEPFVHRQSLASAHRFATVELGALEDKIARAADRALAVEVKLFDDLVGEVTARAEDLARAARALAALDLAQGLATLAVERRYCRPRIDDSLAFDVAAGRHPVVEAVAQEVNPGGESFVANDCDLADSQRLWLLTGPNMAGKSTFLRQNALIAVLAQSGSYVPADSARIGVVDRLYSRVGAADDLARGRSTFMVEMVETATILNQAGPRALVILDEIGRGTATYDGLSIAWATIEHLHEANRCRALFATHYHELGALAAKLEAMSCHTMRVREWRDKVVFLYEVAAGAADRSYGVHVARLAGLPSSVIARAEQVLETLERDERTSATVRLAEDLPLFAARPEPKPQAPSPAALALDGTDVDALSPRQALELLYRLKALVGDADGSPVL
ncbi:MAG: DNA mismatch repair protein MutS [Alphaproteobacteria bacterium]|nr:DNA mismatch repair protein MutS [Alphaproteobacteria bacterium]MDP6516318.1 DNA mismatch repair protein MutS [Alphaproteobacteria bacterium]